MSALWEIVSDIGDNLNKRPIGLNDLPDNSDKNSKHIVMYDIQMHQVISQLKSNLNATRSKSPHLWSISSCC